VVGETPSLLFRVNQLSVDLDLKDTATGFNQPGLDSQPVFDSVRQTGGLRTVISNDAIFYGYLH